jgi:hypothetical protein
MVDTNMDSMLSPVDALMVVNYLNGFLSSAASQVANAGSGEGEWDAVDQASAVDGSLAALATLDMPISASDSDSQKSSGSTVLAAPGPTTAASSSTATPTGSTSGSTSQTSTSKVDSAAADDLFASLAAARSQLRSRFSRKR